MPLPSQTLFPGRLGQACQRELDRLVSGEVPRRLWARDKSLWPVDERSRRDMSANLAWLDLPQQMLPYMARVGTLLATPQRASFQDVVFIAMGDSNLAAEALSHISAEMRWRRIFLLDSTDPVAIRAICSQLDLSATLFVFASKSGKRIETHSLLLYFLGRLKASGVADPGRCCIALTEAGSYLESNARSYGFIATFLDPPGILGRYSSLIHFGLLLSALWRFEPADLASRAMDMRDVCRAAPADANPALTLGALLAAGVMEGHGKLVFLSTRSLEALPHRIGQLVGASTSKGGQGIVPIVPALPRMLSVYRRNCVGVTLTMRGDDQTPVQEAQDALRNEGVPTISIELDTPAELPAEMFKWEVATAFACALLRVNPFDEPDARAAKERSAEMVDALAARRELPARTARVREKGMELYAEGETRQQISTLSLADALRTFLQLRSPNGYVAIMAFVGGDNESVERALGGIREQLESKLGVPVLLSAGPRYLQYFEQVYKGGPSEGLFLILTGEPAADIEIPGAGYTFGQLQLALALGDFDALESRQKFVVRLHFTRESGQSLSEVEQILQRALSHTRPYES